MQWYQNEVAPDEETLRMSKEGEEELRREVAERRAKEQKTGITKSSVLQWRQRSHPQRTTSSTSSLMEHQLSSPAA